jgi:MinD-like ATPase involved in chromosome partitioning or flagellar assembly
VEEFEFAEGFDTPERLAFGLAAGPLLGVVAAVLLAYVLIRSPLPGPISLPAALFLVAAAAGLAWLRLAGRALFDWAVFALQFVLRSRRDAFVIRAVRRGESTDAAVIPLFRPAPSPPRERLTEPQPPSGRASRVGGARRLTFFSLKGGTGRSTLATELACLLASGAPPPGEPVEPLRVALLDLDLRSASVSVRLGLPARTVLDYGLAPPDQRRVLDFMVRHPSGAFVLLGPSAPVSAEWPVNPSLLREVLRELDIEGFDVVIMDLSPELSPLTIAALTGADDVFVMVAPTAGGIHDAYRTTDSLRKLGIRHALRYVVNRARVDTDISEPMADLRGQVVGEIPDDDSVVVAENHHRLVALDGGGPAAAALQRLARRVDREVRFPVAG